MTLTIIALIWVAGTIGQIVLCGDVSGRNLARWGRDQTDKKSLRKANFCDFFAWLSPLWPLTLPIIAALSVIGVGIFGFGWGLTNLFVSPKTRALQREERRIEVRELSTVKEISA